MFTVIAVVCRLVDTSAVATDYNSICIVRRGIDASYQLIDFAEVNKEVVFQLRESKSCVLLDTRYVADFEKGSIPGALSLSLDSGLGEFNRQLESLDKTRLVVLFCQSKHCHFSDYVAAMLTAKGFLDVRIFRGGIEEWFNES